MIFVGLFLGAFLGISMFGTLSDMFFFALLGACITKIIQLNLKVTIIEDKLYAIQMQLQHSSSESANESPQYEPERDDHASDENPGLLFQTNNTVSPPLPEYNERNVAEPIQLAQPSLTNEQSFFSKLYHQLRSVCVNFFTEGNILVRVGAILFLMGTGFLLKYAADHSLLPIEWRIISAFFVGCFFIVIGFFTARLPDAYGLVLQGTGLGINYITLYAGWYYYHFFSKTLTFSLMCVISLLGLMTAAIKNIQVMAVISLFGGFIAPIILSDGQGNYLSLLTYYLFLNFALVLTIYHRKWLLLCNLGFLFTFVISAYDGYWHWHQFDWQTLELYLLTFFFLYLFVAHQSESILLLTALPYLFLSLHLQLIAHLPYGNAISVAILSLIYYVLYRVTPKPHLTIGTIYQFNAIFFSLLVIPFIFNVQWISCFWAMQGCALVWGSRVQQKSWMYLVGCTIQALANVNLFLSLLAFPESTGFIAIIVVAVGGLLTCFILEALYPEEGEKNISQLFFVVGILWWFLGENYVFYTQYQYAIAIWCSLLWLIFSTNFSIFLYWKLNNWSRVAQLNSVGLMALITNILYAGCVYVPYDGVYAYQVNIHLFTNQAGWGWLLAFISLYFFQYILEKYSRLEVQKITQFHGYILAAMVWISIYELYWLLETYHFLNEISGIVAEGGLCLCWLFILSYLPFWPTNTHRKVYKQKGALAVAILFMLWGILINFTYAPSYPLVPFLNPLDLTILIGGYLIIKTVYNHLAYAFILFLFSWLNVVLFRTFHGYFAVPYEIESLLMDAMVQTGLSILWTVVGLVLAIYGSKQYKTLEWKIGAGLLLVVCVKLFIIDLSQASALMRIISFIGVGGLLLGVGFFAPYPGYAATDKGD